MKYEVKAKINNKVVEKMFARSTEEVDAIVNLFQKVYPTSKVSVVGY